MSNDVATEIRAVLRRPKFVSVITADRLDDIEAALFAEAAWFDPGCRLPRSPDNKYLELALAAEASVLVSSDQDLLSLNPWRGIRVLKPADYLTIV